MTIKITESHCVKALDLYAGQLMALPNVQGVGLSGSPGEHSNAQCCVIIYLLTDIKTDLPSYLDVDIEGEGVVHVPVRSEIQGPLTLE